jgi:hypothetical protein
MLAIGIFGGDYTTIKVCMDCGKIQNWETISDEEVLDSLQLTKSRYDHR